MQNHALIGKNKHDGDQHLDEDMVRHMILNSLRMFNVRFGAKDTKYGDLVLCLDSKNNWRKKIFPYYKATRAPGRAKSVVDWKVVFTLIDMIRDELINNMPYKVLQVEGAEADDIIGTLCHAYGVKGLIPFSAARIMIVSGDKDFAQLQRYANVEQYSPIQKHSIHCANPQAFLAEHIARGDPGDGVPNYLSPDSVFVTASTRQNKLTSKKLYTFLANDPLVFESPTQMQQYDRNKKMIDLDCIPLNIKEEVIKLFLETVPADRSKMMNYFIAKRLKNLIGAIGEF